MANLETVFMMLTIVSSVLVRLSPWPDFRRVHKAQATGEVVVLPVIVLFVNCYVLAWYGYLCDNIFPLLSTSVFGLVTCLFFFSIYYRWTDNWHLVHKLCSGALVVIVLVTIYVVLGVTGSTGQTESGVSTTMGAISIGTAIGNYSSPLATIRKVMTTKSTASMPFTMCLMNYFNSVCWIVHGLVISDMLMLQTIPSVVIASGTHFLFLFKGIPITGCTNFAEQLSVPHIWRSRQQQPLARSVGRALQLALRSACQAHSLLLTLLLTSLHQDALLSREVDPRHAHDRPTATNLPTLRSKPSIIAKGTRYLGPIDLQSSPDQAMISKLLKRKKALQALPTSLLTAKSRHETRHPELDAALASWMFYCEEKGVAMTGEAIRVKAARFTTILKLNSPPTWSNGWLHRFNMRHGFGSKTSHGGSGAAVDASVSDLQRQLKDFELRNIFNMDETGLLFSMPPDRTLDRKRLAGKKKDKKRITIAFTCNADGSECLPPLLIGKSKKPRGFKKDTAAELNYTNSPKAWMTRAIFGTWLKGIDTKFRSQHRKCLLLLNNAIVHGGFDAASLTNVTVAFLPPNATSKRQPLDAGIIAAFKRRYRHRQVQHALDQLEADPAMDISAAAKLYKVDVRQAITWSITCWNAMPSSLFAKCWKHTGLLDYYTCDYEDAEDNDTITEELTAMLSRLHTKDPMSVEELLNPPEENIIVEEPTDEDFCGVSEVPVDAADALDGPDEEVVDDDVEEELDPEEIKDHLKWIGKLLVHADATGVLDRSMSGLREMQRTLREELGRKQGRKQQKSLFEFFGRPAQL